MRLSLNRTSVGLKRGSPARPEATPVGPQSNQRGIETKTMMVMAITTIACLNRTSVGLKPEAPPWSSQRPRMASIELAWD